MAGAPALAYPAECRSLPERHPLTPIHQAALEYVTEHRLLVIPLHPREKRPAYKTGENHATLATLNPTRIDEWWHHQDYNIGLPCTPNRLAVIDVDGPEGDQHLIQLEKDNTPLPTTWMQTSSRTDRTSVQYIYRWPDNEIVPTGRISSQLEVRGHGAQVVLTPSIHPTGSTYKWLIPPTDMPEGPATLPTWIITELTRPHQTPPDRPHAPVISLPNTVSLAEKRLQGLTQLVATAPEGQRNIILNHAAYTAARIPGLTPETITHALTAAAQTAGLQDTEINATIRSGINAGQADGPDPDHQEPTNWTLLIPPPPTITDQAFAEWAPVNLRPILTGQTEHLDPPPTILTRDDGTNLLYRGELNWISGEPETGKSWLAQYATTQQINNGENVLYIDLEDTPSRIIARLTGLGLTPDQITEHFHYIRPSTAAQPTDIEALLHIAGSCSLAIIDGTTDLHLIHGLDPETNKDAALIVATLLRPLANAGPAVVPLDHVTKNKDTRGRYAIGAQHKLAAVRGAAYHLETIHAFGRGAHGQARIIIHKDRPGHIRGEHTIQLSPRKATAGDFYLDATSKQVTARVAPPVETAEIREDNRRQEIIDFLQQRSIELGRGLSKKEIYEGVGGNKKQVMERIDDMVETEQVEIGPHRGGHPTFLPTGRLTNDPS